MRQRFRHLAGVLACLPAARAWAGPGPSDVQSFRKTAVPFFEQFCFECHGQDEPEADVNLERLSSQPNVAQDFKTWEKVIRMLGQARMPPDYMPQPSEAQRHQITSWIRDQLDRSMHEHAGDPGHVVMRRLTSAEYTYAIQDLTGLTLPVDRILAETDAAGGEGFTNLGNVQFVQDSTLERYLEAAKLVAGHAVVGAGPLRFYSSPGRSGMELSAIHRIRAIYREHGFRTAAGEGAEPFGLHRYPTAFFLAWKFRHRDALGISDATLATLADDSGLHVRFVEHIGSVLQERSPSFPLSTIVSAWQNLPAPRANDADIAERVRRECDRIYDGLRDWQRMLAAGAGDEEEAPVLTADAVHVTARQQLAMDVEWKPGAQSAAVEVSVVSASRESARGAIVIWRRPQVQFRSANRRRKRPQPLRDVLTPATAQQVEIGRHPRGGAIADDEFVLAGGTTVRLEFHVPPDADEARLSVDVELDREHGEESVVRCSISDGEIDGETAAETGDVSVLLADPQGRRFDAWIVGALDFARKLPEVSHREPAPSDRDRIPAPFDNTYNSPERNRFHYIIKYHRDDDFLIEHMLDDTTRRDLDQAWTDLLTSFDYYDTYARFTAGKFGLDFPAEGIAGLDSKAIDTWPAEPRAMARRLRERFDADEHALRSAEPGHVEDALRFAELAWRRPLVATEQARLRSFYQERRNDDGLDHAPAMQALLARILVAPAFIYRMETPPNQPGIVPLSDWELAGRLSFLLWSSIPDAALRRAARSGELQDPAELARHARRMLHHPKARRFAAEFFGQWFGFYRFDAYRGIDIDRFAEFTDALKSAMYDEAVSFFEHIVREDRPVREILFADYAFINRELADHYGIGGEQALAGSMARIDNADAHQRGGLLRLGAVLTVTSAPLRTSPVKRGDWILRRVLGTPVPPPPPDAGSIPADDVLTDGRTVRERLVAHRRDASCVNCHSRMDPLGFALEHFDPIGRWRDRYRDGRTIDPTGTLNDGTEIAGFEDLQLYLKNQQRQFHRTLCTKLLGYALGRTESVSDRLLIKEMMADLDNGGTFAGLFERLVTSTQFRQRRGADDGPSAVRPAESPSIPGERDARR